MNYPVIVNIIFLKNNKLDNKLRRLHTKPNQILLKKNKTINDDNNITMKLRVDDCL